MPTGSTEIEKKSGRSSKSKSSKTPGSSKDKEEKEKLTTTDRGQATATSTGSKGTTKTTGSTGTHTQSKKGKRKERVKTAEELLLMQDDPPSDRVVDPAPRKEKHYEPRDVIKVLIPVSICMFIVLLCRHLQRERKQVYYRSIYAVFDEGAADNNTDMFMLALMNAGIMMGIVILMTFVMVLLYKFKCYKILYSLFGLSTFCTLTILSLTIVIRLMAALNVPVSTPLVCFLILNWGVAGILAIFWKAPLLLQQATLLSSAAFVAQTFLLLLPTWTAWLILGLLALWDLFAVLAPCGPLRMLVETAGERSEKDTPVLTALAYTAMAYFEEERLTGGKDETKPKGSLLDDTISSEKEENEKTSIKLGLGDFIFYSILIGKAAISGDYNTIVACYVAIIIGLVFTLFLLVVYQKALPALPISITFGLIFHFATRYAITPILDAAQQQQIIF